ncbi:MAG TPA: hypothetical protein VF103_17765 [Polyangiaceae bacterium]
MALTQCPDCGNSISTEAFVCPKCGRPTGKRPSVFNVKRTLILWAVLIVAFLAIWQFLNNGHPAR